MKQKAIIFDIDGTLANNDHRRHHVERTDGKSKDWKAFHADLHLDSLKPNVALFLDLLMEHNEHKIILVTGRMEDCRAATEKWLEGNFIPYDALYMRPSGDFQADVGAKTHIFKTILEPNYDVMLAIDDRDSVVQMWRDLGVECWQVAKGDF